MVRLEHSINFITCVCPWASAAHAQAIHDVAQPISQLQQVIILLSQNYSPLQLLKYVWLIRKQKCTLCRESEHTKGIVTKEELYLYLHRWNHQCSTHCFITNENQCIIAHALSRETLPLTLCYYRLQIMNEGLTSLVSCKFLFFVLTISFHFFLFIS